MWLIILCAVMAVGSTTVSGLLGPSVASRGDDGRFVSVTVISPWLTRTLIYVLPGSLAAMVILGVVALCRKLWLMGASSIAGAILLLGLGFFVMVMTSFFSTWDVVDQCRGPDGERYACLYKSNGFRRPPTLLLARERAPMGLRTTYDVLGETTGTITWITVIRPASCRDSTWSLYPAPGGWLVGLCHENNCYFAYEISTSKYVCGEDLKKISPLILIGKDTEPLAADTNAILSAGYVLGQSMPIADLRAEAARHPNAKIRALFALKPPAATSPSGPAGRGDSAGSSGRFVDNAASTRSLWSAATSPEGAPSPLWIVPVRRGLSAPEPKRRWRPASLKLRRTCRRTPKGRPIVGTPKGRPIVGTPKGRPIVGICSGFGSPRLFGLIL